MREGRMGLASQGRKERALSREESEGPGLELRQRSEQGAARQRRSRWPEWQNPAEEVGEKRGDGSQTGWREGRDRWGCWVLLQLPPQTSCCDGSCNVPGRQW